MTKFNICIKDRIFFIIHKCLDTVGCFLPHVNQYEFEDNMREWWSPQLTASNSLTVNMIQQRKIKTMGKAAELARGSL